VFIDRDGVINENRADHIKSWAEFHFLPGAREAVAKLAQAGMRVFIVSNQAIVNRGLISSRREGALNRRMVRELERIGGRVEAVAICPHRPEEGCACRKPRPGLLLDLAHRHGLDLGAAVLIGDALSDIEAGRAVGCRTILVLTGRGRQEWGRAEAAGKSGFLLVPDLAAAAELVLAGVPASEMVG
jgi:D-glycero-D-manno-heptose 1,7-bisphosphate phosphatase